jgi:biopolymer transport protein ExbD
MMRRRFAPKDQAGAQIELTPLIDMVFIILIFFIVSTSFVKESGISVDRPESSLSTHIAGNFAIITITDDGTVFAGERMIDAHDEVSIRQLMKAQRSKHVVISADQRVTLDTFTQVQDACYRAGAERVDLASEAAP